MKYFYYSVSNVYETIVSEKSSNVLVANSWIDDAPCKGFSGWFKLESDEEVGCMTFLFVPLLFDLNRTFKV